MKKIYAAIFLIAFLIEGARAQTIISEEQNASVDSVKKIIAALPEVKALDGKYDSISNRVQHPIIKISMPDSVNNLYGVQVGYQGNNRYQPHFYFYLNPSDPLIYVEDLDQGDRTTLDEWRKRRTLAATLK